MYGPIWIVWGRSCYYDHDVEFVYSSREEAEAHAERLRTGSAEPGGKYEHPGSVEFWVEERDQTVLG